jgi:hypothetical protein
MEPQQLHVAVFGSSGAGKTVLLAAFFRAQTQPAFQNEHAYKIQATNKAQGSELLGRFYDLEGGKFPPGSTRFEDYVFDFFPKGLPDPGLRIHWYDYPGRWWEGDPSDAEERAQMKEGLLKLGGSHVGLLIADGAKYKSEGIKYIKWLLEHFSDECERLRRAAKPSDVEFPHEWIFALSKADLYPPSFTAADFQREVCKGAGSQLHKMSMTLGQSASGGIRVRLAGATY